MFTKRTLPAMLFVWATAGSAYANVVVDMSQVQDYTKYQTDLQQCEGLAVQNQPSAPQRDSVAGTAVKGAAVGAAVGAGGRCFGGCAQRINESKRRAPFK